MSTQSEDAILNVKINGSEAISTFQQLNQLRKEQITLVKNLNENSPEYDKQIQKLNELNGVYDTWKAKIYAVSEANTSFFSDWKKGFEEVEHIAAGFTIGSIIAQAVRGVIDTVKELWTGAQEAYTSLVKANLQVEATLKSTNEVSGETRKSLEEMSKSYSDLYGIQDKVITKSEGVLLEFTNVRGTIYDKALPAIIDMTAALHQGNVTMDTVESTTRLVGKALDDPIKGITQLGRLTGQFSDQQKTQIKNYVDSNQLMKAQGIILDQLQKKFGGSEKLISESDIGTIQKYDTLLDQISESIGKWITSGKALMAEFLTPFLRAMVDLTTDKLSDTLEDERLKMENLGLQITDTNTTEADRVKLIQQLKAEYPDLLKNLDAEKASNKEVADAVENLNNMYINRIILAKKDEEIEKQNQDTAELRMKQLKAEDEVRTQLAKLAEKYPKFQLPDGTSADKLGALLDHIRELQENAHESGGGIFDPSTAANKALSEYDALLQQATESQKNGNAMLAERNKLQKELGIDENFKGADDKKPNVTPATSGPTQAEKDEAARKAAESKRRADELLGQETTLTYNLNKLNAEQLADTKSTYDKELAAAAQKYKDLIKAEQDYQVKIKASNDLTPGQKKKAITSSNSRIGAATDDKENDLNNLRIKQAKEVTDAIKQYQDQQTANFAGNIDKQIEKNNEFYDGLRKKLASGDIDGQLVVETNRIISNAKAQADGELSQEERYQQELQKLKDEYDELSDQRILSEKAKAQKRLDDELKMYNDLLAKKLISEKRYENLVKNARTNATAADQKIDKDNFKKWEEFAINTAGQIADGVMAITKENTDDKYNSLISSLESQKTAELSNVNLTASQRYQITQKYQAQENALKLKQWQADKDASVESAIINTALSISKTFAEFGWPAGIIPAAGAAIAGAFQVAEIERSKPPQFADGGILPNGPSHAAGGLNVIDPLGRLVANIEGGEPILSRATASANPNLVNALLGSRGQTLNYEKVITASSSRTAAPSYSGTSSTGRGSAAGQQVTADHIAEMKAMYAQALGLIVATDKKPVVLSNRVVDDNNTKMVQIHNAVDG